jgi:type I restriction enzyme S subunit
LITAQILNLSNATTIEVIYSSTLKNLHVPTIPEGEQTAIVEFPERKCAEVDDLITEKQKAAEVMRQYKKSLIYEYVTGKKRVAGGGAVQ